MREHPSIAAAGGGRPQVLRLRMRPLPPVGVARRGLPARSAARSAGAFGWRRGCGSGNRIAAGGCRGSGSVTAGVVWIGRGVLGSWRGANRNLPALASLDRGCLHAPLAHCRNALGKPRPCCLNFAHASPVAELPAHQGETVGGGLVIRLPFQSRAEPALSRLELVEAVGIPAELLRR